MLKIIYKTLEDVIRITALLFRQLITLVEVLLIQLLKFLLL